MPLKDKAVPDFATILEKFQTAFPGDWETRVPNWDEQLRIEQAARPEAHQAKQDRLYAEIVALEPEPYIGLPWGVRDLFKHAGKGSYAWFSVEERKWRPADGKSSGGKDRLMHVISLVLNRTLGYRWLDEFFHAGIDAVLGDPAAHQGAAERATPMLDNSTVLERVEKLGGRSYAIQRSSSTEKRLEVSSTSTPWRCASLPWTCG